MEAKNLMELLRMEDALESNYRMMEAQREQLEEALKAAKKREEEERRKKIAVQHNFAAYLINQGVGIAEIARLTGLEETVIKGLKL